jgi:hypothetical protein
MLETDGIKQVNDKEIKEIAECLKEIYALVISENKMTPDSKVKVSGYIKMIERTLDITPNYLKEPKEGRRWVEKRII